MSKSHWPGHTHRLEVIVVLQRTHQLHSPHEWPDANCLAIGSNGSSFKTSNKWTAHTILVCTLISIMIIWVTTSHMASPGQPLSIPLMINLMSSNTVMLRTVSCAHGHSQFQTHFYFPGECAENDYKTRGQSAQFVKWLASSLPLT